MQDLLQDCMEDFRRKAKLKVAVKPSDVLDLFCSKCQNAKCVNALQGDPLAVRAATQFDRLTNPLQANPNDPKYAQIVGFNWEDMAREAKRLAISAQRNDWTVPSLDALKPPTAPAPAVEVKPKAEDDLDPYEIPITDGVSQRSTPEGTQQLRDSVRHLAEAQGRKPPTFPEDVDEAVWQRAKDKAGKKGHIEDYVRVIYDKLMQGQAPAEEPEPEPEPPKEPAPAHPKIDPTFRPSQRGNAPSQDGMIGGAPVPKNEPVDPWAPPPSAGTTSAKVKAGATITFGTDGKIK
jgi:hypothetical protein